MLRGDWPQGWLGQVYLPGAMAPVWSLWPEGVRWLLEVQQLAVLTGCPTSGPFVKDRGLPAHLVHERRQQLLCAALSACPDDPASLPSCAGVPGSKLPAAASG